MDLHADITSATAPGCGKADGTINLADNGRENFQYSIDGGNQYQASGQFRDLAAGDYKIKIKDGAGCTAESAITLKQGSAPVISNVKAQPPACGQANGRLTVIATGGAGLQYSLDGTTFQTSNVFDKLSGGSFTVSVKDDGGCITTQQSTLASAGAPPAVTA